MATAGRVQVLLLRRRGVRPRARHSWTCSWVGALGCVVRRARSEQRLVLRPAP